MPRSMYDCTDALPGTAAAEAAARARTRRAGREIVAIARRGPAGPGGSRG